MKERPILFSGPMVRAILAGRKTQTRRVVNPPSKLLYVPTDDGIDILYATGQMRCPYGNPGDRLWVRETWKVDAESRRGTDPKKNVIIAYKPSTSAAISGGWSADTAEFWRPHDELLAPHAPSHRTDGTIRWTSPLFMPRWASRITLEIIGVRVERLQEITETDAVSEGVCTPHHPDFHVGGFHDLWDSINAKRGFCWDKNPFVWVISFRKVESGYR